MTKKRTASSRRWLARQERDPYVKEAQSQGMRSRAGFKIREMQQRYRFIKQGMSVLDLGAAPGGWSAEVKGWVGRHGGVVACDLLEMEPIKDVVSMVGDFNDEDVKLKLKEACPAKSGRYDVILSDIAPNMTGHRDLDQDRIMVLVDQIVAFCTDALAIEGSILVKLFQGQGFDQLIKDLRLDFKKVNVIKPPASRSESREQYVLATGFRRKAVLDMQEAEVLSSSGQT